MCWSQGKSRLYERVEIDFFESGDLGLRPGEFSTGAADKRCRKAGIPMTVRDLDAIFPWIVLLYGFVITFVLNQESLVTLAERRLDQTLLRNLQAHRGIAFVCLVVGGLWTLQNLWIGV